MIKWYKYIENLWFTLLPQKLRFLLVGGFNTVSSYVIFVIFTSLFAYQAALIITYFLSINLSIITMRCYVFRTGSLNLSKQYLKAGITYLLMLLGNAVFLWLTVDFYHVNPLLSQAIFTIISTILLYYIHKNVNFHS